MGGFAAKQIVLGGHSQFATRVVFTDDRQSQPFWGIFMGIILGLMLGFRGDLQKVTSIKSNQQDDQQT